jgi:hypothetical protein
MNIKKIYRVVVVVVVERKLFSVQLYLVVCRKKKIKNSWFQLNQTKNKSCDAGLYSLA